MAKVNGTAGNDILIATQGNDEISALEGNDRIIASRGDDTIDGGTGNDSIDYRSLDGGISFDINSRRLQNGSRAYAETISKTGNATGTSFGTDRITNIERIIGNSKYSSNNTIRVDNTSTTNGTDSIEIDLAQGRGIINNSVLGRKDFTFANFDNVSGGVFSAARQYRIVGNDRNNLISIGSRENSTQTIVGSKGNDTFFSSANGGQQTLDYSNVNESIVLNPDVKIASIPNTAVLFSGAGTINKGGSGTDKYSNFNRIVGNANRKNTIDGNGSNVSTLDVDLSQNIITALAPDFKQPITVENFTDVIGSKGKDRIIGGNSNSNLNGAAGNDTVAGGTGDDIIAGTSDVTKGVNEVDTLTGGGGVNTFTLGGNSGAYYLGGAEKDYALITNFDLFNDTIDLGNTASYDLDPVSTSEVNLFTANNTGVRDLVAKIQLSEASQISFGAARSARATDGLGGEAIDPLVPPIKILSTQPSFEARQSS